MPTKDDVMKALQPVEDPELKVSIVDLGLIYDVHVQDDGMVNIDMTLTSPACPLAPQIEQAVKVTVANLENVKQVNVNWTFSPPWDPQKHCSEDAKIMLGIF